MMYIYFYRLRIKIVTPCMCYYYLYVLYFVLFVWINEYNYVFGILFVAILYSIGYIFQITADENNLIKNNEFTRNIYCNHNLIFQKKYFHFI